MNAAAALDHDKQMLLVRSSMHRVRLRREMLALGESLQWKRAAVVAAGAPAIRTLAIGFALSWLGFDRAARWVKLAGRVVMVARLARATLGFARSRMSAPACATVQTEVQIPRTLGP